MNLVEKVKKLCEERGIRNQNPKPMNKGFGVPFVSCVLVSVLDAPDSS